MRTSLERRLSGDGRSKLIIEGARGARLIVACVFIAASLFGCQRAERLRAGAVDSETAADEGHTSPQEPALDEEPLQTTDPPEAAGWRSTTVLTGLEHPWGLVFLPNGDMLITERPGRLRRVRNGELIEAPLDGVPRVLALDQGGLLDIALHPDFEVASLVYLTYASGTRDENQTTLARARLEETRLTHLEELYRASPSKEGGAHFGSRILFLPDGTLLMSIGDGGNPPREIAGIDARDHAQRLDTSLGSIVRLAADGSIPNDNPFVGQDEILPELYSYGHRNIQGLALDPTTGNVWANEHGPLGGDELNLVRAGENHGWPEATHGADYRTGERFTPHRVLPGGVAPVVVWTPAKAPSGLAYYTGDAFPEWQGDVFSGGLVGREVRRIVLDGEQAMREESLTIGRRVRDVKQGPDGYLYILTDERDGALIRIEPD